MADQEGAFSKSRVVGETSHYKRQYAFNPCVLFFLKEVDSHPTPLQDHPTRQTEPLRHETDATTVISDQLRQ